MPDLKLVGRIICIEAVVGIYILTDGLDLKLLLYTYE
jgi:hypothetical protein